MKVSSIDQVFRSLLLSYDSGLRTLTGNFTQITQTAQSESLALCLEEYLDQCVEQLRDSERLLRDMKLRPTSAEDIVMERLAAEASNLSESDMVSEVMDLLLARCFLRIQHTQIASLSVLQALAEELGDGDVLRFVRRAVESEITSEEKLSKLLESSLITEVAEADS